MKISEVIRVTPPSDSPESATELCLPLTYSDLFWFKLPPVERLFFYQLNELTPACFNSVVLPKLKRSLSLTLLHYLPVAGNLKWPPDQPKPVVLYTANDGVPLTVAESSPDFNLLTSNGIHDAVELHPLKPELIASDVSTSTVALQITLFPNMGFCIGITAHHAVLDGKTTTMFVKSWAHICNHGNKDNSTLPLELIPFFDRSVLKGPDGLDMLYLDQWLALSGSDSNKKSLEITTSGGGAPDLVRATFEITRDDLNKLRERVLSVVPHSGKDLHLSTFVLSYAYVTTCMVKARGDGERRVLLGFTVDCRSRLNPPVPENYFGNCNRGIFQVSKARDFLGERGFVYAVQKVGEMVKGLTEKGVLDGIEKDLTIVFDVLKQMAESEIQIISVAGSPRFGVYGSDLGWGKPKKVVIVSIDKSEAFSMAESRDGGGGVEIGLALKKNEMDKFSSLFLQHV
ncbi:Phenolic glucoside malonyltransferase 1 [Hibiscus syriacus]|uniref:Phenolic glucoside malonyltransferase 1 n=1 Tax=Hibiscus syriacus TaxID=106335 RepID=A0A6A3B2Y1_HIBSY|nr:phenolic glucoside malonyltransferase 1-like [Hibiscus syriacus]KAE8709987.1 Phenolic glucoside malonyltransferase 1 [Hibiscus syriacus]